MKILTLAFLLMSQFVLAQTCLVDMINRSNRVIQTFRSNDHNNSCMEGMKQCRLTIRTQSQLGGVDCIRRNNPIPIPTHYPTPNPYPTYYPTPNPYPTQFPTPNPGGYGYPTVIIPGETVVNVSNQRLAQVIAQDYYGKFLIRYIDNGVTSSLSWQRVDLAPMRGCDGDICVNDPIINVSNGRNAIVIALQMGGKFILKYSDNNVISSLAWLRQDLAITRGCQSGLCVGAKVINVSNRRYASIQALQLGERFMIRYEDNGVMSSQSWSITDLAPIFGGFNF